MTKHFSVLFKNPQESWIRTNPVRNKSREKKWEKNLQLTQKHTFPLQSPHFFFLEFHSQVIKTTIKNMIDSILSALAACTSALLSLECRSPMKAAFVTKAVLFIKQRQARPSKLNETHTRRGVTRGQGRP